MGLQVMMKKRYDEKLGYYVEEPYRHIITTDFSYLLPTPKVKPVGEPLPYDWPDKGFWPITIIGNMVGLLIVALIFLLLILAFPLTSQACEVDSTESTFIDGTPVPDDWITDEVIDSVLDDWICVHPIYIMPDPLIPIIDTTRIDTTITDWELRMVEVSNCEDYPKEAHWMTAMGCPPSKPGCNYCMSHRETVGKAFPVYDIKYHIDTIGYRLTAEQLRRLR